MKELSKKQLVSALVIMAVVLTCVGELTGAIFVTGCAFCAMVSK